MTTTGSQAFEQITAFFANNKGAHETEILSEDYELWKKDFTWDALHGIRYGQSFCNRFRITDNHLYYSRDVDWCDDYIRKTYIK